MPILLSQNIPTTIFCATLTTVLLSGKPVIIPTATLLEHALLAQGFMGISKVAFPRRLQLPNRDSTGAKLSNAIKCRCRVIESGSSTLDQKGQRYVLRFPPHHGGRAGKVLRRPHARPPL